MRNENLKEKLFFESEEFGGKVSSFYKIPRNASDLLERSELTYEISKDAGSLLPHIGTDAFFATKIVTSQMEEDKYEERLDAYMKESAQNNRFLAGAQIDVKGNRSQRPAELDDPDLYVHVVEEKSDGIVVKGAKSHTTYTPVSDGLFVLPGRSLKKDEEDYAIAFAVPANADGLKLICRPAISLEAAKNPKEAVEETRQVESTTVFDDVFVPWDRVFLYKDTKRASKIALNFALWHRLSALSYRTAMAEDLIGLGKLIAEANGVDGASHIQKDIVQLISYAEIQKLCAKMAANEYIETGAEDIVMPNPIYTNVGKLYSNSEYMNIKKALIDIAGGLAITAPSGDDYENEELRKDINKYLQGTVSGEERFKLFLILRELLALKSGEEVTNLHAEGSIRASEIELYRSYDYSENRELIERKLSEME